MTKRTFYKAYLPVVYLTAVLWLGVLTQASAQHYIKIKNTKHLYRFFERTPDRIPMISAHRGGPTKGYPENCIATFEQVLRKHPALIECDVRQTRDNRLVMMHDRTLNRTTNGEGRVSEKTWADLKNLRLKDNAGNLTSYKIPTFKEVLEWTKGKTILTLDIKRGVSAKLVVDAIRETRSQSYVAIIVYNLKDALKFHKLAPKLMLSVSVRNEADVDALKKSGIPLRQVMCFAGVGRYEKKESGEYRLKIKRGLIAMLHKLKMYATVGTMRSIDRAGKQNIKVFKKILTDFGGDILATDEPEAAYEAVKLASPAKSSKTKYFKK
ncbi:MAG TPA: glycerophosphodiester phosphodiesterase [Microscillaceae bacterium]|nr:glycerophosphodiester phosphodiesterase [Microscillaceae bacterium]